MKSIPIYFDSTVLDSPKQLMAEQAPGLFRLQVAAFTKYKNRNGSYITDEFADHLIESATRGNVPVIGFYDPETSTWASHTGPKLARAYGYVEGFIGWQPLTDTDGVSRDYAVFSVILFIDYYEEANKIIGQNQSMELDINTIQGEWAIINDEDLYVYTEGDMAGFCVIGAHEPCFSMSAFVNEFTANFASLLGDLKEVVNKVDIDKGGELPMPQDEQQVVAEAPQTTETEFAATEEVVEETEQVVEDTNTEEVTESTNEEVTAEEVEATDESVTDNVVDFEQQFNDLQVSFNELQQNYEQAQARINELEQFQANVNTELEQLRAVNATLNETVTANQTIINEYELNRKHTLIDRYNNLLSAEQIEEISASINDLSYDALESKLAIQFANHSLTNINSQVIPVLEEKNDSPFAKLMQKYKKNR